MQQQQPRKNRLGSMPMTDDEWLYVKKAAARAGQPVTTFIRNAALDASNFPRELRRPTTSKRTT